MSAKQNWCWCCWTIETSHQQESVTGPRENWQQNSQRKKIKQKYTSISLKGFIYDHACDFHKHELRKSRFVFIKDSWINVNEAQMLPPCSWRPGWVLLMTTPRWLCCCWSGCGLPNRTNNILHISALYQHNQHQPTPVILHNSWKLSHQRGAKQESKVSRTIFRF